MKKVIKSLSVKLREFWAFIWLSFFSSVALADNEGLDASTGAIEWVVSYLTTFALVAMGLLIIAKLLQIQFQDRDWREVVKPVLVTSAIVGVKLAAPALISAMGASI